MAHSPSGDATRAAFFRPGNVVRLKEPFKPSDDQAVKEAVLRAYGGLRDRGAEHTTWEHAWQGYTHGIVVEVVSHERRAAGSLVPRVVSLHLYDSSLNLIYIGPNGIPMYVDYHVTELTPWADATALGYGVSDFALEEEKA
jgi:hypothetical protein